MRHVKYIVFSLVLATLFIFLFDRKSSGWSLFNLFDGNKYTIDGLNKAIKFDPDKDIFHLPKLENKNIFEATDDLSICRRPEVRKYLYLYLTVGRPYVKKALSSPKYNLKLIESIFKENPDIPIDVMFLPLLESGFNPRAVSRTKATGVWQFVRCTSRLLGLKNNKWVDERRNVEKSTKAAIRHLRTLYKMFNSWEFALAAYNGGAGHVSRAMKKHKNKDFWDMIKKKQFRTETTQYVPRFAALLLIYKNQGLFGINIDSEKLDNDLEIDQLVLKYPIKIHHLSKISGIPTKTLKDLNPELKGNLTPPYKKNYSLLVPKKAKEKIKKEKPKLYKIRFSKLKKHRVKKGECISKIARLYRSSFRKIVFLNNLKKPYRIYPGKELYIPIS